MGRITNRAAFSGMLVLALLTCSLGFVTAAVAKPAPKAPVAAAQSLSTVNVTVKSVTGRLVSGADVEIYADHLRFTGTTNANGVAMIEGVPSGTYYLGIHHRLFCDSYYKLVVDEAAESYTATAHPKSLWEGIGY